MKEEMRWIGYDYFRREVWEDIKTGIIYKKVDGVLHTITAEGEPIGNYLRRGK